MSDCNNYGLAVMGITPEMAAHLRAKRHGKFRYWTNRRFKDIENLRRVQRILAREAREKTM